MHDPKRKQRDLQRAYYTCQGFCLHKYFDRLYPELANSWQYRHKYYHLLDQWVKRQIGSYVTIKSGSIPSHYRRGLNQQIRSQEKQAIRDLIANGEFEEFILPRNRRNVRWLYW